MALQTFTWNNGTNAHPVELTSSQLANLLKLALNENVVSGVRGHITTSSGQISKYTKWQLNQKYGENLVIHAEEIEDTLSIIPIRDNINEGERTNIITTGMTTSSIKFRLNHNFRSINGIQQSAAQSRIHMDGNTLIVNDPEENASWIDEVTIQAIPVYEDWNTINPNKIAHCQVIVNAKALTGIVLSAPNMVEYGENFESEVTLIPSTNTKGNFVTIDATCLSDGSLPIQKPTSQRLNVYTYAPAEECELTLTANAYLFNDLTTIAYTSTVYNIQSIIPFIRFNVTAPNGTMADIIGANSGAGPIIKARRVDENGDPIDGSSDIIAVKDTTESTSTCLVYKIRNVKTNGSERYRITSSQIIGYTLADLGFVTPISVITDVAVTYNVIVAGLYVLYSDGTLEHADELINRGSPIQNKTPFGIRCLDAYVDYVIPFDGFMEAEVQTENTSRRAAVKRQGWDYSFFPQLPNGWNDGSDSENFAIWLATSRNNVNVQQQTTVFMSSVNATVEQADKSYIHRAYNKTITFNGQTYHGYVGNEAHYSIIQNNKNTFATIVALCNVSGMTLTDVQIATTLRVGDRSMISVKVQSNNNHLVTSINTASALEWLEWQSDNPKMIPIYFINLE